MPEYPVLSGAEIVMRKGEAGCVVPMHREVKRGTLGGIIRQAGVTPEAFLTALR